jgi:hypothetical protein
LGLYQFRAIIQKNAQVRNRSGRWLMQKRSIPTSGVKLRAGWDDLSGISLYSRLAWMRAESQRETFAEGTDPDACAGTGAMSWWHSSCSHWEQVQRLRSRKLQRTRLFLAQSSSI